MQESKDKIHSLVRGKYAAIAKGDAGECAPACCGGSSPPATLMDLGKVLDYTERDLALAPGEANLGLGCGNPISRADWTICRVTSFQAWTATENASRPFSVKV
jgi:hypothetical protein